MRRYERWPLIGATWGCPPAGIAFGAASLAAWLGLQIAVGSSIYAILGTETALAAGILFVLLLTTLLERYALQTRRVESLLEELHAAHRELEAAHRKEKELAVAEERVRLARDLHDSVAQLLYSVTLYAAAAAELLSSGKTETAIGHLRELGDTARQALREMRLLIFELHRATLESGGLAGALQARLDAVEARGGIHAELTTEGSGDLAPEVAGAGPWLRAVSTNRRGHQPPPHPLLGWRPMQAGLIADIEEGRYFMELG